MISFVEVTQDMTPPAIESKLAVRPEKLSQRCGTQAPLWMVLLAVAA